MNKYISTFYFCAITLIFSCTDPNLIGLEVQPPSDGISVSLTSNKNNLKLSTISEDSLRSDEASTLLLGAINDPVFGNNQGFFLTQILLSGNSIDLGDYSQIVVDSSFITYNYSGYYGAINNQVDIGIRELERPINTWDFQGIFKDSVYYSNFSNWDSNPGEWVESYSIIDEDTISPILKIKLHNLKIEEFLYNAIGLGENNFIDNETFLNHFSGLMVWASSWNNTILYLNPTGTNSKMSIYYHNINDADSVLSLDFSLSGDAARVNLFNDKDMSQLLQQADTSTNTYVQSMAGYKTVIEIQHLDTLKTFFKNKAINRVNLSFELDGTDTMNYSAHNKLFLVRVDENGKDFFLSDLILEGEEYFGGKLENGKYTFNITRYFYQLLNNEDYTNKLYLVASGGAINASRTILPKNKISFNIIYTDL
ncbi:MAG: DUF4270 family protein [Flavobacteriales bacterium]|nr:DUF4270 family protein [Flavobacteriales bacterium]